MNSRRLTWSVGLLLAVTLAAPSGSAESQARPQGRGDLFLNNGDLVTATGRDDAIIRLRPRTRTVNDLRVGLETRLKPKGLNYSKHCEKIAIANSINVVTYDVWSLQTRVIEYEGFGQIADVHWDMQCNLIVADMGKDAVGRWPRDGKLWRIHPDGRIDTIGGWRHNWVNPAFLDMDEWGTLYVLDKAAGRVMPGTGGEWHFDAIYKLGPPDYRQPKVRFRKPGLDASAFAVHPDGRFFIGNGAELVILDGKTLRRPCEGSPFSRINGIGVTPDMQVYMVDGFDVFGGSRLLRVDDACRYRTLAEGPHINGAQGLAVGLPAR